MAPRTHRLKRAMRAIYSVCFSPQWHRLAPSPDIRADRPVSIAKSKKQRRLAAKRLRKATTQDPDGLARHVPLEEQSVDLPANENGTLEGALEAGTRREELTHRLRQKRRASIKEANFLKGMR